MGTVSPLGNSTKDTWEAAKQGKSGIGPITRFDVSQYATKIAGELKGFDAKDYLDAKELKKQASFSHYAIAASQEAWDDAKLGEASFSKSRMGTILGVGIGGITTLEKYHEILLKSGPRRVSPFLVPAMISNLGPGNVGIRFGLEGINFCITSACTSATHAIGEAYRMIANDIQDVILTGGSESAVSPIGIGGFCAMKAMTVRNDEPERASRPFDKDRDGFVLGEGSSVLCLESLESAEKRGAHIYAEVIGYGASCDAYHITAPSTDGKGAISCMSKAIEDSGLAPEQIQYVNAHGTSTPANDKTESKAIETVFGGWATKGLAVSSTKSMTGHLLGAAGAIEAVFCALSLQDSVIAPTINLENQDEECRLDYVPNAARECSIEAAMSNSFGFGGTNASVILKKAQ